MTRESTSKRSYPWTTNMKDTQVKIRLMKPEDQQAMIAFADSLPESDLLFLSVDITKPEVVEQWARNLKAGRVFTALAEVDGKLIGHGTLSLNDLIWMRHLGEVQLMIR